MTKQEKFIQFLEDNNATDKFLIALKERGKYNTIDEAIHSYWGVHGGHSYIMGLIDWGKGVKAVEWYKLDKKWRHQIN